MTSSPSTKGSLPGNLPWHLLPAVALAAFSASRAFYLPATPVPPGLAQSPYPLAPAEIGALVFLQLAIIALLPWAFRFLTRGEGGRFAAGLYALVTPLAVLWQEGANDPYRLDTRIPAGPWAGLVIGFALCGLLIYLHFIFRARSLRHGSVLLFWPMAIVAVLEVGINLSPLKNLPLFTWVREERTWPIMGHTNLYGQWERRTRILFPHGELIPMAPPAGRKRILAIGSSSTYGAGLSDPGETWPAQLEKLLPPEYQVLNAGFGGYNSFQIGVFLEEVLLRLRPSLVIFYYGGNEKMGVSAKSFYRKAKSLVAGAKCDPGKRLQCLDEILSHGTNNPYALSIYRRLKKYRIFLAFRSVLKRTQKDILWTLAANSVRFHRYRNRTPPTSKDILVSMSRHLEKIGAPLVLVPEVMFPKDLSLEYLPIMQAVRDEFSTVDLIDPLPAFASSSKEPLFLDSSTHLTPLGCRLLARRIADELARLGHVPALRNEGKGEGGPAQK